MNKSACILILLFSMLFETANAQYLPHIHENLIEDFHTYNKAYRDSYRKSSDLGAIEDWAVAQKYKVQLLDSRLLFDQAYDEDLLSKEGLMEYLELLIYQREFVKFHQILESDVANRFKAEEIGHFRELSSAWRMIIEYKRLRPDSFKFCTSFDAKGAFDWKNPHVEFSWNIDGKKINKPIAEYCFSSPGVYKMKIIRKNKLTGFYLPDSTYQYVVDEPLQVQFNDIHSVSIIGQETMFEIDSTMADICEAVWTMGDGTIKIGNKITHKYTVSGTYTVTQYLTYSEHGRDFIKSKSAQIFIKNIISD